jgi:hypothetical protein
MTEGAAPAQEQAMWYQGQWPQSNSLFHLYMAAWQQQHPLRPQWRLKQATKLDA